MKLEEIQKLTQVLGIHVRPQDQQAHQDLLRRMGINPGEFYQELEMSSRYVDTHRDVSFSNAAVSLHSHAFHEILYCRNTCGAEYLIESVRYQLRKGDIIMIPPGVSHRPLLSEHVMEPYHRDVLWLSTEYLSLMAQILHIDAFPIPQGHLLRTAGTRWEYLGELFNTGVEEFERKEIGWEAAILGNTAHLLTHLHRAVLDRDAHPPKAEKPDLIDQVMGYVETHLSEKISLSDVAHHFFVSESTISHIFRKKMDASFYRCVTQRRLIAAKSLIAEGLPLENIASRVGFSDYSTFYRAFRQEYGISPRQYRKRLEAPEPPLP